MNQKDIERIEDNPLKEIKRRFNDFVKEADNDNLHAYVGNIIVGDAHSVCIKGASKNYTVDIEIRERKA